MYVCFCSSFRFHWKKNFCTGFLLFCFYYFELLIKVTMFRETNEIFDELDTMNDLQMNDEKLYKIVCQGDLHDELDEYLKSVSDVDTILQKMYELGDQSVSLLMLAAQHGFDRVIRILISHSSNVKHLVNMHGNIIDLNGNLVSHVSALWCACDRGYFDVARTLIEHGGANVHSTSRNPILISAIVDERYDIIEFLIENNYSDMNQTIEKERPFYNGLMISAAHGQINIVRYLLSKGANVDFTSSSNFTALACAASEGHLEIIELLCAAGASTNVKTNNNETPLILAFENDHLDIVDYLFDQTKDDLCLDEIELVACSIVLSIRRINNSPSMFNKMIHLMRKIFQLRTERNSLKPSAQPIAAYNFQQECQTIDEFEKIQHDHHRLYIEALLIRERILLPKKLVSLCEPLLIYGQNLVEQGAFEQCLRLWHHTFYLYQNMNFETSLHRFVWLFCKMIMANVFIPPDLFVQICRLTFEPSEQNKKNHSIKNSLCLITIAAKVQIQLSFLFICLCFQVLEQPSLTKLDRQLIYRLINDICRQQRTTIDGQTLLHLCVNEQTYRDINYRANEIRQVLKFVLAFFSFAVSIFVDLAFRI